VGVLGAICLLVLFQRVALPQIDDFVDWFASQMPAVSITEEGAQVDAPEPYEITHPEYGPIVILDTTRDAVTQADMGDSTVYLTKQNLYVQSGRRDLRVYALSQLFEEAMAQGAEGALLLTGERIYEFYQIMRRWMAPFLFTSTFFFIFFWKLAAALIYSLIALGLNQLRKEKLDYGSLLLVSMFAITPVFFLQILSLMIQRLNVHWFVAIGVTTVYLALALLATQTREEPAEQSAQSDKG